MAYTVIKEMDGEFNSYLMYYSKKVMKLTEFDKVFFYKKGVVVKQLEAIYDGVAYNNLFIYNNRGEVSRHDCVPKKMTYRVFEENGVIEVYKDYIDGKSDHIWCGDLTVLGNQDSMEK